MKTKCLNSSMIVLPGLSCQQRRPAALRQPFDCAEWPVLAGQRPSASDPTGNRFSAGLDQGPRGRKPTQSRRSQADALNPVAAFVGIVTAAVERSGLELQSCASGDCAIAGRFADA
jgi:hypothetical protein